MPHLSFDDFVVLLILTPSLLFLVWILFNLTRERTRRTPFAAFRAHTSSADPDVHRKRTASRRSPAPRVRN